MSSNQTRIGYFGTPVLRYVGAKWMLADWIIGQFPPHSVYCEPFAGSAAVFFRKHPSSVEYLNDLDGEVVNFFTVLRERSDELIYAIEMTPYSRREYEMSFEYVEDPVERARRFYISCWQSYGGTRTRRSGWRNQCTDAMRTPVPQSWGRLDGLRDAVRRLKNAYIDCSPAHELIQRLDSPDTLFYVDPPYLINTRSEGGRARYTVEMDETDHRELADLLNSISGMVVLSGYPSDLYAELYTGWTMLTKTTTTTGNSVAVEALWLSPRTTAMNVLPLFAGIE